MQPDIHLSFFGADLILKSYAVFTVLGATVAAVLALPLLRRAGLPTRRSLILMAVMAVGFLAGARLLNRLVNPGAYGESLHLWTLRLKGFSVYGGIAGALAALLVWLRLNRVPPWPILDAMTPPFGVAFATARVGCYLNGCCGGIPTSSACDVVFPSNDPGELLSDIFNLIGRPMMAVYPTQLFEMGLALLGLVPVLWAYYKGKAPPGTSFLVYAVWFSAMRLAILPLRSLPYPDIVTKLVYPLLYGITIIIGSTLLIRLHTKHKNSLPAE